mgnify:CR=1 FL=1
MSETNRLQQWEQHKKLHKKNAVSYSTFCERIRSRNRSVQKAIDTPKSTKNQHDVKEVSCGTPKRVRKQNKWDTPKKCTCTEPCNPSEEKQQEVPKFVEELAKNTNVYPHKSGMIIDFEGNTEDQVKDNISQARVNRAVENTKARALRYMFVVWVLCFALWVIACRVLSYFLAQ